LLFPCIQSPVFAAVVPLFEIVLPLVMSFSQGGDPDGVPPALPGWVAPEAAAIEAISKDTARRSFSTVLLRPVAPTVPVFADVSEVSEVSVVPVVPEEPVVPDEPVVPEEPVPLAEEVGVPVSADSIDCRSAISCVTEMVPACVIPACPVDAGLVSPVDAGVADAASDVAPLLCPAACVELADPLPQPPNAISAKDVLSDSAPVVPPTAGTLLAEPEDGVAWSMEFHPPF
jgi:hypothetical protein